MGWVAICLLFVWPGGVRIPQTDVVSNVLDNRLSDFSDSRGKEAGAAVRGTTGLDGGKSVRRRIGANEFLSGRSIPRLACGNDHQQEERGTPVGAAGGAVQGKGFFR